MFLQPRESGFYSRAPSSDARYKDYRAYFELLRAAREYERQAYDRAMEHVEAVLSDSAGVRYERRIYARALSAQIKMASERSQEAIDELSSALVEFPNDAQLLFLRGVAFLDQELYEAAIKDFDDTLRVNDASVDAYVYRAMAIANSGNTSAAMDSLSAATRLFPESVELLACRAQLFSWEENADGALADLRHAISLQPTNADLYVQRGRVYIDSRDFKQALKDFSQVVSISPNDPWGYLGRGDAYFDLGDLDRSLEDYEKAIELESREGLAYYGRGTVNVLKGHHKQAMQDLSKTIELTPQFPDAYILRAELQLRSNDSAYLRPEAALQDAKRACDLTEWKDPHAISLYAASCAANKDYTNAIRWAKESLLLSAPSDRVRRHQELLQYQADSIRVPEKVSGARKGVRNEWHLNFSKSLRSQSFVLVSWSLQEGL